MTAKKLLKFVRDEIDRLSSTSPLIPQNIQRIFHSKFKDRKDISFPMEINGLEKVIIFDEKRIIPIENGDKREGGTLGTPAFFRRNPSSGSSDEVWPTKHGKDKKVSDQRPVSGVSQEQELPRSETFGSEIIL
jgi:hypothetical protein